MNRDSRSIAARIFISIALLAMPCALFAQQPGADRSVVGASAPPEAPQPQSAVVAVDLSAQQTPPSPSQATPPPAQTPAAQGSSSSQAPAPQPAAEKSQHEKAEEQLKEEEKQRVVGIMPTFNVSYRDDAVSLSATQKIRLAFRSSIDSFSFGASFLVAGYHEAMDDDPGFGWGAAGFGKRSGAAYLDLVNGTMIGNGFLPALLHQDPRYFRLGHGTVTHRALYSIATNFICKHDNTGKWEPNYSNVGGNIIAGALSNYYYPSSNSGVGLTISNGLIVTAEGAVGQAFEEFWPDISRRFLHKDPTHGLDAKSRALDAMEKETRNKTKEKQKQQ